MPNTSISLQIKGPSSNLAASAKPDTAASSHPEEEQFSNVLAREITDKKSDSESDATTQLTNKSAELLPTARVSSSLVSTTLSQETLIDAMDPNDEATPLFAPIVVSANIINNPTTQSQGKTPGTSLSTSEQTTQPLLSRHTSAQNSNYSENSPWQPPGTTDFSTSGRKLSPFNQLNKATSIASLSAGESSLLSLSDTTQPVGPSSIAALISSSTPTALTPHDLKLDVPIGQPKWDSEFSQKIVWLAGQQQQTAEIRLNPAHLGPVEVLLKISNDQETQATIQFVSSHSATREAIEAALPKLREMMAENGITLGNVSVGAESFQQQADSRQHGATSSRYSSNNDEINNGAIDQVEASTTSIKHNGLVNTFA